METRRSHTRTWRRGGVLVAVVLAAVAGAWAGCGAERKGEPLVTDKHVPNPQVVEGQRVFMHHCNQCHPGGAGGLGPAINDKPLPGALIKTQVRLGLGAMPKFDQNHISDQDLDNIVAYLEWVRSLQLK